MPHTITCVELDADEWVRLRDIRLRALLDSPHAFGGTYEKENLLDEQQWRLDFAKQTLDGIAQITAAFGKNNEKTAKRAFQIQKAISIAQATISTYDSANAIFASTAKNPITTIFPGAPFVAAGDHV